LDGWIDAWVYGVWIGLIRWMDGWMDG